MNVLAHYRVKRVTAGRVVLEVDAGACGQGRTPADGSLNFGYEGSFELDRRSGLPLSATLRGCCAKADATAALARVAFELTYRGTPVVAPVPVAALAGTPVNLLGVVGQ